MFITHSNFTSLFDHAQVVEKLVDIVTFIHQEIPAVFGDNGMCIFYIFPIVSCICPLHIKKKGMTEFVIICVAYFLWVILVICIAYFPWVIFLCISSLSLGYFIKSGTVVVLSNDITSLDFFILRTN